MRIISFCAVFAVLAANVVEVPPASPAPEPTSQKLVQGELLAAISQPRMAPK